MSTLNLEPEPTQATTQPDTDTAELDQQCRSGANWFYWIAGLSLVNTAIFLFGGEMMFITGLGLTRIVDEIIGVVAAETEISALRFVALVIDLVVAGFFVLLGMWAGKRHQWAFIVGIVIYGLDGLLLLGLGVFMSAAFHGFALFFIIRGLLAARQLNNMATTSADIAGENAPPPPPNFETPEQTGN